MIPAPPADAALPGLAAALDGDAMREVLGAHVAYGFELRSCRPSYVRYKPSTSCLVQYRLALGEQATGATWETLAQVRLYAGRRAEKLWAKGRLQRLAASAQAWNPEAPVARVAHLAQLGAVAHSYPVDLDLPTLVFAASAAGGRRVLRQVRGPSASDDGRIELVRYKPGRKALLRYGANGGSLYAKVYAGERGRHVLAAGRAVEAAGIATASSLAYLASLHMLVQAEAAGLRLRDLRGEEFERGARAAGEALAVLHAVPVPDLARHSWADEAAELAAAARAVGALRPDLAEETTRLAERVIDGLAGLPLEPATTHGDASDDQVLVAADGAFLLDLDEIRAADRLRDVGNFLAHLSLREDGERARASFLDGYGDADGDAVALLEAGALLKLAVGPFRRLEPDWPEGIERGIALARLRLPRHAHASVRDIDPALPQLAALTHPVLLAQVLESDVYAEPVRVLDATIVRHKRGRRCTLRYDLEVGAGRRPERLYGKAFASDRGPRVYRTWQAVADARACGPAVAVAEPAGQIPRLRLYLQRPVAGEPARDALLAGDRALAVRIADAVHALHTSPVRLEREHGLADELRALRARVEGLAAHGGRTRECLVRLERAVAAERWEWRSRPVHRDLYHDQVLVDGTRLALLDFDDAATSEPALDVANFLAHLRLLALQEPLRRESVGAVAAAFRARSTELDPLLDSRLVQLLECATLLRLACIHEGLARRLLRECESLLPAEPRAPLRVRNGSRLALALDGRAVLGMVAAAVEVRAGAAPGECRALLLRRKKGRAVVLYELETAAGPVGLVGKWFRDDRGAAVADLLAALRERGFADGAFAVSEPVLYDPELRVLFTDRAAGPSLRSVLDDDQKAARRAGAWLARFHHSGVVPPRVQQPAGLLRHLARNAALKELAAALAPALRSLPSPGLPTHGDFASADVLVPPDGPTVVVDFDGAASGDPAFDVANFEATLEVRALRRHGEPAVYATAKCAFRAGYEEYAPLPPLAPAVDALVWLRLAHRNGAERAEVVRHHALDRARSALEAAVRC